MSLSRSKKRSTHRGGGYSPSSVSRSGGERGRRVVGPVLIACAIVAVLVAADYWLNAGKIYRGVEVGEISLGGKTPEEAERIVQRRATGALKEIEFSGPEEFSRTAEEMGVLYDVEATVAEAYAVGREGNLLERLGERLKAAYGTVDVSPKVEYRPQQARAEVEEIAARLDAEPVEATVRIVGPEVEVGPSAEGYKTDVAATMRSVNAAVEDMSGEAEIVGEVLRPDVTTDEAEAAAEKARRAMDGELVLTANGESWTVSPAAIGTALNVSEREGEIEVSLDRETMRENLANVYAALTVEPVEASYQVDGSEVSVVPGQTGRRIEDEKFLDAIEAGIFEGQRKYEVPVVTDKPELTTAEARRLRPTELLATYETNYLTYDDTPGRVENLQIASEAVNGTLLAPGEVFSFNELAAPLEYNDTKVIVNGRVDTAEGGGLCQVSSTLYMAANFAGLDVIERHPHYAELPYIRPGFDATVWFGALDMKFKNTSPGYVLIQQWVDTSTGTVHAAIYGKPTGKEVEMTSRKVAEYSDGEGNPVTEWVTYQKVTENGKVVFNDVLHKDTYKYLKPAEEDAPYDRRPVN
ncbi:MAG: peptidoglycan binding domain-containing protein [Actinomycetota bacterium]